MEFSYEILNGRSKIVCQAGSDEKLDTDTWKMLVNNPCNQVLLSVSKSNKGGAYRFCYDIEDCINMKAWMSEASEEEKHAMREKIQYAKKELTEYMIPEYEILMEEKYMYVNEATQEVQLICIPLICSKKKKTSSINVSASVPPLPERPPVPKSESIYEEIPLDTKKERKTLWGHRKNDALENDYLKREVQEWEKPKERNNFAASSLYEEVSAQREMSHRGSSDNNSVTEEPCDDDAGTILLTDAGNEGTVLLKRPPVINARLVRVQTQEEFSVNKAECKIGKRSAVVDICLKNNPTISREHCRISYCDGEYYIEDCNSSNFTYLEGKQIMPGEKAKLQDGNKIQLSDEEFIFYKNGEDKL